MAVRMKACLNGGRRQSEHPAVPVTPAELAAAASAAVAAGAEALHLHPRDRDGLESLGAGYVAAAVTAVRAACGTVPIGVSTGLWIAGGDPIVRHVAVHGWADLPAVALPDFASVNLSEPCADDLVTDLDSLGVAAEAGVWSVEDARLAAEITPAAGWLRLLVEVIGVDKAHAVQTADDIVRALDDYGVTGPRLLHGEQEACWPLVSYAGHLGVPSRIGLEDTTVGPGGEPVRDNADLVRLGLAAWIAGHEN
jgi:uncharacterized protein (DUF849 family)